MRAHHRTPRATATSPRRRRVRWAVAAAMCLIMTVLAGTAGAQDDDPAPSDEDESPRAPGRGGGLDSGGLDSGGLDSGGAREEGETNQPSGQVAYITADGEVLVGIGEAAPATVAAFAYLGANGQGAVVLDPTGENLVYVRSDGALVLLGTAGGGEPILLATDVALDAVGNEPVVGWDSTGSRISYVAEGTEDMVADSSTRPRSREAGTFLAPLPDAPLGNVLKTVTKAGSPVSAVGDPSLRSVIGVNWSPADPVMVVDSEIPGTSDRYTLSVAAEGSDSLDPTILSLDSPDFAPDGSFVVASGPSKGLEELTYIALDDLTRLNLAIDDSVCGPAVSPDATRVVYGGGENCSRVMLVSSSGGRAFDITPLDAPDTATFGVAELSWTTDGRFVTYPGCETLGGQLSCGGPSRFLEPDTGRVLEGPDAVTVAPIRRPLIQDVWLDFVMRGPLEASNSFLISAETQAALTETEDGGFLEATVTDGLTEFDFKLTAGDNAFVTGTVKVDDPESGINRTFTLLGRANVLGVRILSVSGIWMSVSDLPFATGEFDMAIRRR